MTIYTNFQTSDIFFTIEPAVQTGGVKYPKFGPETENRRFGPFYVVSRHVAGSWGSPKLFGTIWGYFEFASDPLDPSKGDLTPKNGRKSAKIGQYGRKKTKKSSFRPFYVVSRHVTGSWGSPKLSETVWGYFEFASDPLDPSKGDLTPKNGQKRAKIEKLL